MSIRIASGVTDQYIYFVGVDATDFTTRETGLSSFTVYRSRNGNAAAAMTTPTVNETDATNMPGVYELLLDEDMTIDAGDDTQEMVFHITASGMAPVTRTIELYRPKITAGNTLGVASDGDISGNIDGAVSSVTAQVTADVTSISGDTAAANNLESDYDGTGYNKSNSTIGTCTTNSDMRGTDSALLAASAPTNFSDLAITATTGRVDINVNNDKTGYFISGTINTLDGLENISAAQVNVEVDTALADIHLDHLFAVNYDPASKPGVTTALLNELIEDDGGVSRFTANALEQAPSGGGGTDWTSTEREQIRYRLGVDGTTTVPSTNSPNLDTVDVNVLSITAASANTIADHTLRRNWGNTEASSDGDALAFRSLFGATAKLVNRVAVSGASLNIYRDDDTTVFGTQTLTTDAGADPITELDTV